jgi:hypothetical protein
MSPASWSMQHHHHARCQRAEHDDHGDPAGGPSVVSGGAGGDQHRPECDHDGDDGEPPTNL